MGRRKEARRTTLKAKRHTTKSRAKPSKAISDVVKKDKQRLILSYLFKKKSRPKRKYRTRAEVSLTIHKDTRRAKRHILEKTWQNTRWRKKWRARWGKNKWNFQLKEKWTHDHLWRKKWMKRLRENWWNVKWRRKWQELFLLEKWRKAYSKERNKRRHFWKRKWKTTGSKKMGLSFNEFLLTQRRSRAIKNVSIEAVRRGRKAKRYLTEGRLSESTNPLKLIMESRSWKQRLKDLREKTKIKLTKNYNLNPALLQFRFYFFNVCQGALAFLLLLSQFLAHAPYIPNAYGLTGFFILLFSPAVTDCFGSIFGMFTSSYLGSLYDYSYHRRKKPKTKGCFGLCPNRSQTTEQDKKEGDNKSSNNKKEQHDASSAGIDLDWDSDTNMTKYSDKPKGDGKHRPLSTKKGSVFRGPKSLSFVQTMGCISYIFLQKAFFFNLLSTGYYTWMEYYSEDYKAAVEKCKIFPSERHCFDFEDMWLAVILVVVGSFLIRTVFLFIIGMCISERYLKRCQTLDPAEELPSTNSDTEIDYQKVPKNILIPYLLSDWTVYPYVLPESCRPLGDRPRRQKAQSKAPFSRYRNMRATRRIQSAVEKEANKSVQGFRGIRKATVPLPKGRRQPFRLPPTSGVPDTIQLPPELMTTEARTWLSEEETESSEFEGMLKKLKPKHLARKQKKNKVRDAHSLILVHAKNSLANLSISDVIEPKLEDLDDRISTDESWSDKSDFLFEPLPEKETTKAENDLETKPSEEVYFDMMAYSDQVEAENPLHLDLHHAHHPI